MTGRDGITLCEYRYRFWEVATTATVTVFDRAGKRLATVYLAFRPELGQATMSQMLTGLLTEVFQQWQGPLPTLAYVADSGGQESSYFEDALAAMRHPRTGQRLSWQRVVDFYHAAARVWTMGEVLFGKNTLRWGQDARRLHFQGFEGLRWVAERGTGAREPASAQGVKTAEFRSGRVVVRVG